MKAFLPYVAACFLMVGDCIAIPQTFSGGNNGFFFAVGVPFEQYASAAETWRPGAELKGTWRAQAASSSKAEGVETLDLEQDATVLGIPAAKVSVERAGGAVRRFVVRFDEASMKDGGKARAGGLLARLTANLTALAGEPKSVSPGGEKKFQYESSLITARRSGGREVIVEFTPAR